MHFELCEVGDPEEMSEEVVTNWNRDQPLNADRIGKEIGRFPHQNMEKTGF